MSRSMSDIAAWIKERVSELTGMPSAEIDENEPLLRLGLDSVGVVTLAADLEKWAGYRFQQNPLEEHPSINALAEFVARETASSET
jgi:polyketide synthase 13